MQICILHKIISDLRKLLKNSVNLSFIFNKCFRKRKGKKTIDKSGRTSKVRNSKQRRELLLSPTNSVKGEKEERAILNKTHLSIYSQTYDQL